MTKPPADRPQPAVFLDRDGTLMEDVDYCSDPKDVHVFEGASRALRSLKDGGYRLFVITNQSGIGRGYFSEVDYRRVEAEVLRQVGDGVVAATYFCPDTPDTGCSCRKPSPALVLQAAREHRLDLANSYFIGDKAIDVQCGRNAGVRTILVQTGYGKAVTDAHPDAVARDVTEAAEMILRRRNG
jgi:D-glycero-D-manno-heptose 1,7-bisphosphate phosphatase